MERPDLILRHDLSLVSGSWRGIVGKFALEGMRMIVVHAIILWKSVFVALSASQALKSNPKKIQD
jgi:hypothetical protein